jgi:proteasome lid subunit RPN8/RPN11
MKGGGKNPKDIEGQTQAGKENVSMGQWSDEPRPVNRTFPGPRGVNVPLRVAIERKAFADVVAHARESLDAEICGVVAGQVCEDDEGIFVHVEAAIRGAAARESNARVTFTQETWKAVHETLERDYPKLRILGWYHSHPGFGVEFSEMDVFIQKNFFPAPTQIALLTDPLSCDVAICRNAEKGVEYFDKFWADGREHSLRSPAAPHTKETGAGVGIGGPSEAQLQSLETRLGQLIQAVDDQRTSFHRFLITLLILALAGIAGWVGWDIYFSYTNRFEPPHLMGYIPEAMRIGDKTFMIGIGVVQWDVPPELSAAALELEKEKLSAEGNAMPSPGAAAPLLPSSSPAPAAPPTSGTSP